MGSTMLDGKRFIAEAGPIGEPADIKGDVITFADGRFHSAHCDQWDFSKSDYTAVRDGDVIRFEAVTLSPSDGRLHWKGTIRGDSAEGVFVHHRKPSFFRPNPEPIQHWFKAKASL
jgi:hypothetical protein